MIAVLFIGFFCGLFTMFLDFCIGEPGSQNVNARRIFSFYGLWIRKKYDETEQKIQQLAKDKHLGKTSFPDKAIKHELSRNINWFKALGVCPNCANFYITVVLGIPALWMQDLNVFYVFFLIAVSHTTVNLYNKLL